jgi:hypothetical protein
MMTQTMNCRIPQRAPEILPGQPSDTHGDDPLVQSLDTEGKSEDLERSSRPEPTRGVKKVPSLRRGAGAYARLLQSAVKASIESRKDDQDNDDA